ncbi:unnamed protein product [Caenorhabditis auriculariae]|uniref:Ubiquitin-conjugating enzyme E2 H n=1 Tax=Caenorhabditis auriculariae TaxID=2777116 RepID=A0A8S1HQF1_9PELO|nr:unnamed protein product [Caenorhabditis auriculariae]
MSSAAIVRPEGDSCISPVDGREYTTALSSSFLRLHHMMLCPITQTFVIVIYGPYHSYLLIFAKIFRSPEQPRPPCVVFFFFVAKERKRALRYALVVVVLSSGDTAASVLFSFLSFLPSSGHFLAARMSSPSSGKRRMDTDVIKLIESHHEVTITGGLNEFSVKFYGPKGTSYEGGVWRVRVDLPEKYPFKSPSIGFMNKIYHPNIDEASGTVCLDVINQAWTALYDLANIFESFLPQLLTYPNAQDPLNGDAASLYLHRPDDFKKKCRDYVELYASETALQRIFNDTKKEAEADDDDDSVSSMSDYMDDDGLDLVDNMEL